MTANDGTQQEIDQWLQFALPLDSHQQLNLIGLLQLDPSLKPATIDAAKIVGENKCRSTAGWARSHFHDALRVYCKVCNAIGGPIGFSVKQVHDFIQKLVPILTGLSAGAVAASKVELVTGLSVGGAVGFSLWAVQANLQNWCAQFAAREFDGKGTYKIVHNASREDPALYKESRNEFSGVFSFVYCPAITRVVKSARYPTPQHEVHIVAPARARGAFSATCKCSFPEVVTSCDGGKDLHSFEFTDTVSGKEISGGISKATINLRMRHELLVEGDESKFKCA